MIPEIGSKWKHYKNNKVYTVIAVGIETETEEEMVIYQCNDESDKTVWIRPIKKVNMNDARSCWEDEVSLISGETTQRFIKVG